jgi:hypothetical protein
VTSRPSPLSVHLGTTLTSRLVVVSELVVAVSGLVVVSKSVGWCREVSASVVVSSVMSSH